MHSYGHSYQRDNLRDGVTGATQVIDVDHAAVHFQLAYSAYYLNPTVAAAGYLSLELRTPAGGSFVHLKHYEPWAQAGPSTFQLLKGPSITSGATRFEPVPHNHVGDRASRVEVRLQPTVSTTGLIVEQFYLAGANNPSSGQSVGRPRTLEHVLQPGAIYVMRIINGSAGNAALSLNVFWYEEDEGLNG